MVVPSGFEPERCANQAQMLHYIIGPLKIGECDLN